MEWISKPDTSLSNKFIFGEYTIRYQNTIYGYQYIIYKKDKEIDSCQTLDGAKQKVSKYWGSEKMIL